MQPENNIPDPNHGVVVNCGQILTLAGPNRPRMGAELQELGIVRDAAMHVADGRVVAVGSYAELKTSLPAGHEVIDAQGRALLPGFVDAHTHLVFGGNRVAEYEQRIAGKTYQEIAAAGGGIISTLTQTRNRNVDDLTAAALEHARWFLRGGTTTIEAKSGYGLTYDSEMKILHILRDLPAQTPLRIVPTLLAAHTVPPEFKQDRAGYVALVSERLIPSVAKHGLAQYCDVFCDDHAFTLDESRTVLTAAVRPHPGQIHSAAHMASLLAGSRIPRTQGVNRRIQDAYCLRCIPQVHGAAWDAICAARRVFEIELNSATDNPLVFDGEILSGGNFHGAPLALSLDFLAIALCQVAGISERRMERLVNPVLNEGLPAFLASNPGIESGLMIAQVTAAGLCAEMKVLATPASTNSLPTSGNQEDFVSMGMTAALKLEQSVSLARMVIAVELIAATRALDLRGEGGLTAPILDEAVRRFREHVPAWEKDCVLSTPIMRATEFIASGAFSEIEVDQPVAAA